jgi:hypothetical protein
MAYLLYHLDVEALCDAGRDAEVRALMTGVADTNQITAAIERDCYALAARVETPPNDALDAVLERIFISTQNLETSWAGQPAPGIVPATASQRSTSVGDLVVAPDNGLHICDRIGWRPLGPAPSRIAQAAA